VVPELKITNPRICGVQVRHYARIGLQYGNNNGVYPSSPSSVSEPAGQHNNGDQGSSATIPHQSSFADPPATGDEGNPSSGRAIKQQVSSRDEGDEGKSPLLFHYRGDEAANAAYLNGLCRDGCGNAHSPGRTRCDECHRTWQTAVDGYDR
jgi:hypothetical protein